MSVYYLINIQPRDSGLHCVFGNMTVASPTHTYYYAKYTTCYGVEEMDQIRAGPPCLRLLSKKGPSRQGRLTLLVKYRWRSGQT